MQKTKLNQKQNGQQPEEDDRPWIKLEFPQFSFSYTRFSTTTMTSHYSRSSRARRRSPVADRLVLAEPAGQVRVSPDLTSDWEARPKKMGHNALIFKIPESQINLPLTFLQDADDH